MAPSPGNCVIFLSRLCCSCLLRGLTLYHTYSTTRQNVNALILTRLDAKFFCARDLWPSFSVSQCGMKPAFHDTDTTSSPTRPTRLHPCKNPREDVGIGVGVVEFQLNGRAFARDSRVRISAGPLPGNGLQQAAHSHVSVTIQYNLAPADGR